MIKADSFYHLSRECLDSNYLDPGLNKWSLGIFLDKLFFKTPFYEEDI